MKMRIAAAALTGLAAFGMTASPAQADNGDVAVATSGTAPAPLAGQNGCISIPEAEGCFFHHGDRIWVKDKRADGLRAIVQYRFNYNRAPGECHQTGGAGAGGYCDYQMWEGGRISIRVVTRDGATGPNVDASPWSPWLKIG